MVLSGDGFTSGNFSRKYDAGKTQCIAGTIYRAVGKKHRLYIIAFGRDIFFIPDCYTGDGIERVVLGDRSESSYIGIVDKQNSVGVGVCAFFVDIVVGVAGNGRVQSYFTITLGFPVISVGYDDIHSSVMEAVLSVSIKFRYGECRFCVGVGCPFYLEMQAVITRGKRRKGIFSLLGFAYSGRNYRYFIAFDRSGIDCWCNRHYQSVDMGIGEIERCVYARIDDLGYGGIKNRCGDSFVQVRQTADAEIVGISIHLFLAGGEP